MKRCSLLLTSEVISTPAISGDTSRRPLHALVRPPSTVELYTPREQRNRV
jgi:hypothetical protein